MAKPQKKVFIISKYKSSAQSFRCWKAHCDYFGKASVYKIKKLKKEDNMGWLFLLSHCMEDDNK